MWDDRYGPDPLADMRPRRGPVARELVTLARGLVLEHTQTEWCGAVVGVSQGFVQLEDFGGKVRSFPLTDGFLIDGKPVQLEMPKKQASRARTASGSFAGDPAARAKVARASRIFVEGRHDAELVEDVWGADLREVGVVVELLDGADHLAQVLQEFQPGPGRRAGILLDHLVAGSKESRIAEEAVSRAQREFVQIAGHPFIDIWQAIKPARVGLQSWPEIPRSIEWKKGICQRLGWPHAEQADIADAWQRLRERVRDYRDLEPALVGPVEGLIDFVTAPA